MKMKVTRSKTYEKRKKERKKTPMLPLKRSALVALSIEVFDDLDKVGADVVLLHCCPQSCMPNAVEGRLEIYKDIVEVLLVLEIFITEDF